jgi:hypothetical protein
MMQLTLIGLGAGAASALLFGSVASGSLLSVLLFYLAPLPILIAALGWSHWAGLLAAITASAGLAAVFDTFFFVAFLCGIGLPAWWLGYLALLARPTADGIEWYPVGHLVMWAALVSALVVGAAIVSFGADEESFHAALRRGLDRMLRLQGRSLPGGEPGPAGGTDWKRLVEFLVVALPPAAAVITTITNVANLWLAAKVVTVSGRLRRPMPDIPAMRFPAYAPGLLAVAIGISFLPGLIGIIAGVLAAAMLMAYALLGLAVLHAITRGIGGRALVLGGIYLAVFVLGWPVLAVALLGLADTAFDIRGRVARRGPPAPPPT